MQLETAKNKFLSLFSGYLHLPVDPVLINIDYDDLRFRHTSEDEKPAPIAEGLRPAEDGFTVGGPPPPIGVIDHWDLIDPQLHNAASRPFVSPAFVPPPLKPPLQDAIVRGSGAGGPRQLEITVDYAEDGNALDLKIDQVNMLVDNDVVGSGTSIDWALWPQREVENLDNMLRVAESYKPVGDLRTVDDVVQELQERANGSSGAPEGSAYTPEVAVEGAPTQVTVEVILPFVPQQEIAATPIEGATVTSHSATLEHGVTVDGQTYERGSTEAAAAMPEGPGELVPETPTDTDADMAVISTGGNSAANGAGLVDMQIVGTLAVLGDSYHSNMIVQTNVLVDQSVIVGAKDTATIQTGGSETNNVAEFINSLEGNPYEMGFFGGLRWHVDRLDGDFFDVKMVTQLNDMRDNDLVQQVATDHYKYVETGSNGQANLLEFLMADKQYDLIIVNGNYYGTNWIFQTNVLLNSDYVQINEGEHGSGDQTVSTGANWLMNSARIVDFYGQAQGLTPEMQAVINSLQGGQQTLDLNYGYAVAGNGSLDLNVLFIDGDYYDINVLEQTNIMQDTDSVVQTLAHGESGHVVTGGNELTNEAVLVNLGPLGGEYVGGTAYSESVLIQTNIVVQSTDQVPAQPGVITNDPTKLTAEAGVFLEHAPTPDPEPAGQSTAPPSSSDVAMHNSDPLAGVLT